MVNVFHFLNNCDRGFNVFFFRHVIMEPAERLESDKAFSNSLIIHQAKTQKIPTGLN